MPQTTCIHCKKVVKALKVGIITLKVGIITSRILIIHRKRMTETTDLMITIVIISIILVKLIPISCYALLLLIRLLLTIIDC